MGWIRNHLVFPDKTWEIAARKLDGEFIRGKWLANSKILLSYRSYSIALGVGFSNHLEDNSQFTKAIPSAVLARSIRLFLSPRMKGVMGSLVSGLAATAGKAIDLPGLDEEYQVIGEDPEVACELFGHPDFLSALKTMSITPAVAIGGSPSSWVRIREEDDESDLCVSVPRVVKNADQLVAIIGLTKVLLDLLEKNSFLR